MQSSTNKIKQSNKPFRARENDTNPEGQTNNDKATRSTAGILVAHGPAKYLHDKKNNDSYFVTTRDDKDNERTAWGVDLKRAMQESGANINDKIHITNEGRHQVTVTVPVRNEKGQVVGSEEKETQRIAWNVKVAEAFFKETPAEVAKIFPELANAAAAVAVMDMKAEVDGLTPEQRSIVATRVRQNVVNSIARGDIPEIKIKEEIKVQQEAVQEKEYSR